MPYADNSPERRNLVVCSLGFILYYLGGGKLKDNTLQLPVVNIEFTNHEFLAGFAWVMLLWFFIRYWQKYKNELTTVINKEVAIEKVNFILIWYLEKILNKPYAYKDGFIIRHLSFSKNGWIAEVEFIEGGHKSDNGQWEAYTTRIVPNQILSGYRGLAVKLVIMAVITIKNRGIGSYFMPYLVFGFAVAIGGINLSLSLLKSTPYLYSYYF